MKYPLVPVVSLLFLSLLLIPGSAMAGAVTGVAYYEGAVPKMRPIDMSADPVCLHHQDGEPATSEVLVLGEGEGEIHTLGNVFVEVVDGLDPDANYLVPEEPVVLTQTGCQYSPRVFGVRVGQTLQVLNPDGTLHNVNGLPEINRPFNQAMPRERQTLDVVFEHAEPLFPIRCDVHPWMAAYCAVMEHPYFDATDRSGRFSIDNLPPGEYEIRAWHERLGTQTMTVEVTENQDEAVEVELRFSR